MPGEAQAFPSDALLQLLTDALRDGPGSPTWHAAMERLNAIDASATPNVGAATDEYRRLCTVREHLESGKKFRSIRPGPAFTARLWAALDGEGVGRSWRVRGIVTVFAAGCVLLGCMAVIWQMIPRALPIDRDTAALSNTLFTKPLSSLDVANNSGQWLAMWKPLTVGEHDLTAPADSGGGFVLQQPMQAIEPFAVEARFELLKPTSDLVPELAVSDIDDFQNANTSSSHETVVALENRQVKVIATDGRLAAQATIPGDGHGEVTIRLLVSQHGGIVEINGRPIYSGALGLSLSEARFIAVRILRRGSADPRQVALRSVNVLGVQ